MHQQRRLVAFLAVVGGIAAFLPWFHAPLLGTVPGVQTFGKYSLLVYFFVLLIPLIGDLESALSTLSRVVILALSSVVALVGLWKLLKIDKEWSDAPPVGVSSEMLRSFGIDIGFYLTVATGFATTLFAALAPGQPEGSTEESPTRDAGQNGSTDTMKSGDGRRKRRRDRG